MTQTQLLQLKFIYKSVRHSSNKHSYEVLHLTTLCTETNSEASLYSLDIREIKDQTLFSKFLNFFSIKNRLI